MLLNETRQVTQTVSAHIPLEGLQADCSLMDGNKSGENCVSMRLIPLLLLITPQVISL